MGLYMVQPYEPGKIPVLMVHGLWSSPMTWMEMFNDLRSQPEIRDHYQFWFYLYPTGQPFWLSAAQLRRDLAEVREMLDPQHQEPALDQMVLVGHSMGGLVSRLQTVAKRRRLLEPGQPRAARRRSRPTPRSRQKLAETFFFQPNPSIRRVVTIGTPHRGSTFSNQTTQWLLGKLIHLPQTLVDSQQKLFRDNQGRFADGSLLKVDTSIDSLSPDAPIFPVMLAGRRPPWVQVSQHRRAWCRKQWWLSNAGRRRRRRGVARERTPRRRRVSEITVPADHTTVHTHPAAVLEVRRILLEHLSELQGRTQDYMAAKNAPGVVQRIR